MRMSIQLQPILISGISSLKTHLSQQDEHNRIAGINTGVPADAWSAVTVHDPGPDGVYGDWDDNWLLKVYAQQPSTFGKDWMFLSNISGPRVFHAEAVGELQYSNRFGSVTASYMKTKTVAQTSPGNTPWQNDPDMLGMLFQNPNNVLYADGHTYFDHANVGKISVMLHPSPEWPSLGLISTYADGLPFNRQFLVTGLPQGPFLVNTTIRGSPEGGNRSEHIVNTDVRISRLFSVHGELCVFADVLNVLNGSSKWKENDATSPQFNSRPPLEVQSPRSVRVGLNLSF